MFVRVVERAQRNLGATRTVNGKKRRAVATSLLKNSLSYVKSSTNNFEFVNFTATGEARKYANVVELGRRPYPGDPSKRPPVSALIKWIKNKPVRLKNKDGQFIKMTESAVRSAAYAMSVSIGKKGIPGLFYYRDAMLAELADRGPDFIEALKKEIAIRFNLGK